jgi:Glycosyl transferase family 2
MPDRPRIWFITTCMGRLSALEQSLPTFCRQSNSRVVVVDYSCPDRSGDWVEAHHPECQVVRVPGEEFFHSSRARNAGVQVVPQGDDWVCFVDADVCLSPSFCAIVRPLLEPGRFAVLPMHPRNKGLTGLILASRGDVARCGGFDEGYRNYGRQASAMRVALFAAGLTPVFLGDGLARHLDHGDEVRSRHYRQRDLVRSSRENSHRLRALIQKTEVDTGKAIPPELCHKEMARGIGGGVLRPLRAAYRLLGGPWRSRRRGSSR